MINAILTKIVGSKNERMLKRRRPDVERINSLEPEMQALSDEQKLSKAAQDQVALLNQQLAALRQQLASLQAALDASEARDKEQQAVIADLGQNSRTVGAGYFVSHRTHLAAVGNYGIVHCVSYKRL